MKTNKRAGNFPAFPFPGFVGAPDIPAQPSNSGMPFRDYIAIEAMKARIGGHAISADDLAVFAYDVADAMLDEREK